MRITKALLESKEACNTQIKLFAKLFPRGVTLTKAICMKHAQEFQWNWAAENLLSNTARAEYWKIYGLAWAEYKKATDLALVEYWKITGLAWAEYDNSVGLARAKYIKQCAIAFWKASKL